DLGCGDGFHLSRFARAARRVVGVEPYEPLVRRARARVAGLSTVEVKQGSAQRVPLPDNSVDLVHARTAYFFGPGCQRGPAEVAGVGFPVGDRVLVRRRPAGLSRGCKPACADSGRDRSLRSWPTMISP